MRSRIILHRRNASLRPGASRSLHLPAPVFLRAGRARGLLIAVRKGAREIRACQVEHKKILLTS